MEKVRLPRPIVYNIPGILQKVAYTTRYAMHCTRQTVLCVLFYRSSYTDDNYNCNYCTTAVSTDQRVFDKFRANN